VERLPRPQITVAHQRARIALLNQSLEHEEPLDAPTDDDDVQIWGGSIGLRDFGHWWSMGLRFGLAQDLPPGLLTRRAIPPRRWPRCP
jgi:hypothetical protein